MSNKFKVAAVLALIGFGLAIHSFGQTTITNRGQVITVYTGTALGDRTVGADDATLQRHEFPRSVLVGYDVAVSRNLAVTGTATIGGALTLSDNLDVHGNANVVGALDVTGSTTLSSVNADAAVWTQVFATGTTPYSVTNNASYAIQYGRLQGLVSYGGAANSTNSITVPNADPGDLYRMTYLWNSPSSTNRLMITGDNIYPAAATNVTLLPGDGVMIMAGDTNTISLFPMLWPTVE